MFLLKKKERNEICAILSLRGEENALKIERIDDLLYNELRLILYVENA